MPQQLKYVAQLAMDNFFQNYRGESDFWELDDFVSMCGNTISGMYYDIYKQKYAMLRQEKKTELVAFDSGWLVEEIVTVKQNGIQYLIEFDANVMTFPFDQNDIGIQNVFNGFTELERVTLSTLWQLNHLPKTNRIFYYLDLGKIGIYNSGDYNVKELRVLYVPAMIDGESPVADGLIGDAIAKTVMSMRQMASGEIVDKTDDFNTNKILQTELDKNTLAK